MSTKWRFYHDGIDPGKGFTCDTKKLIASSDNPEESWARLVIEIEYQDGTKDNFRLSVDEEGLQVMRTSPGYLTIRPNVSNVVHLKGVRR